MENTRYVYVILVEKPLGKRPLTMLRRGQEDNMIHIMKTDYEEGRWIKKNKAQEH
jgi:hypothetical protein